MGHEPGNAGIDARRAVQSPATPQIHIRRRRRGRQTRGHAWRAVLFGPAFPILLHVTALRHGNRKLRATVVAELLLNVACITLIFRVLDSNTLRYHIVAMVVGQCLTTFFAVWTVHHHCDRTYHIARTLRNKLKNGITFKMFLHIAIC